MTSLETTKPASKKREKGKKKKRKAKKKKKKKSQTHQNQKKPSRETKQCSDSGFIVWVSKEDWYDCECK